MKKSENITKGIDDEKLPKKIQKGLLRCFQKQLEVRTDQRPRCHYKNYDKSELLLNNSGLVALILLIALLGFILMLAARKGRCIEQAEHLVYFKDISEAAEWADYVFIARVEKKLYTKQYDGTGFRMPYSYYSLADIQFLKGEDACDKLLFYGGYSLWNQLIVFEDNTELPRPGEYYLFTVRKANAENTRVEADSYTVITKAQMLPLEDYIPDAGFDDQNDITSVKRSSVILIS